MIEGLINKCYDASNTINPTTFIVRKRLCNYYRISLCIVSCSTLIWRVWRCEKVEKDKQRSTKHIHQITNVVSVHLCAVMGWINWLLLKHIYEENPLK